MGSTVLLDVIRSLYQYSTWANQRILISSSNLTPEQFVAPEGSSYPSVRDTLVHTMSAEWIWLSRWNGISPNAMFKALDYPNIQSIQARWDALDAETQKFIDQLKPAMLAENISYVNLRGEQWAYPLWQQMFHQVNHGTQHRSEVAALLTQFGFSPGNLDFLVFQDKLTNKK
jgi:uncharacterized damage-inducible protein DinB